MLNDFYSSYAKRPPYVGQKMDDTILVERAGYVSAQERIEALIEAGIRLQTARTEQYDSTDGSEMDDFDIRTRRADYDIADGSQDLAAAEQRIKDAEKQKVSEVVQDNPKPPESPPPEIK